MIASVRRPPSPPPSPTSRPASACKARAPSKNVAPRLVTKLWLAVAAARAPFEGMFCCASFKLSVQPRAAFSIANARRLGDCSTWRQNLRCAPIVGVSSNRRRRSRLIVETQKMQNFPSSASQTSAGEARGGVFRPAAQLCARSLPADNRRRRRSTPTAPRRARSLDFAIVQSP